MRVRQQCSASRRALPVGCQNCGITRHSGAAAGARAAGGGADAGASERGAVETRRVTVPGRGTLLAREVGHAWFSVAAVNEGLRQGDA